MNKGLEHSQGDFVLFLNAGDCLASKTCLDQAVRLISNPTKTYFGRAKISKDEISWLYPHQKINNQKQADKWVKRYLPNHQAMLFTRCFYSLNKFNPAFKVFGDVDYKIRVIKQNKLVFLDIVLSTFQLGGISSSYNKWSIVIIQIRELDMLTKIHYDSSLMAIYLLGAVKFIIKYFLRKVCGDVMFYKLLKVVNLVR